MEKRMDETMDAEKFLKELIHRALLGDEQAQQECTEKRIALPCPYCGSDKLYVDGPYRSDDIPAEMINDIDRDYDGFSVSCSCGNYIEVEYGTFKDTLAKWNTRLAPPVIHAKWEWHGPCRDNKGTYWATCTACGIRQRLGDYENYCPKCGAKMNLEEDE